MPLSATRHLAAVDLGASSGRVVLGRVGPDLLELREARRFPNSPVVLPDGLHWDALGLYREVLHGLGALGEAEPVSVGIDSWAVDYCLLDAAGAPLGLPYSYRDSRTEQAAPRVVSELGAAELYAVNGLQYLPFNTIFQLAAEDPGRLSAARRLLLLPDLLAYWLTGVHGAEVTNASTTGLLDAAARRWDPALARAVGLDPGTLPELSEPGAPIGELRAGVAEQAGLSGTAVLAVASHDTASAVVGVPATADGFGYISAGTWSLAGVELDAPVRTEEARKANFTNELGLDGTTRFLRNIMGLWLLQESLRTWGLGEDALPGLLAEAARRPAFTSLVDAFDERFIPPGCMPARIAEYCAETGQPLPADRAATVRCILESLALAHRVALRTAAELSGQDLSVVHMVGGGVRNELLGQLTADALGLPVAAGPVEATALGNVLVQARAAGVVGDLHAMRALTASTHELHRYEPQGAPEQWTAAARRLGLE